MTGPSYKPECRTCPYVQRRAGGLETMPEGVPIYEFECRRNPPMAGGTMEDRLVNPFQAAWPDVTAEEWCGEHPAFHTETVLVSEEPTQIDALTNLVAWFINSDHQGFKPSAGLIEQAKALVPAWRGIVGAR